MVREREKQRGPARVERKEEDRGRRKGEMKMMEVRKDDEETKVRTGQPA